MTNKQQALEELMAVMDKWGITIYLERFDEIEILSNVGILAFNEKTISSDDIKAKLNRMKDDAK